jgi:long-chain fatty acid transport protein
MYTNITLNKKRLKQCLLFLFVLLSSTAQTSFATNGLNQIGFGTESVGMGGADIAVARDTSALNTNPAGLSQIKNNLIDLNGAIVYTKNIKHKDQFGCQPGTYLFTEIKIQKRQQKNDTE